MNNKIKCALFILIIIFIYPISGKSEFNQDFISKLRITAAEIPEGFVYGIVPSAYKKIFKDNPWQMDTTTIHKLTRNIYPDGDSNAISGIHMSILASKSTPYGDDIVCYLILYKNNKVAEKEIKKINEFAHYNCDRAIVVSKDNIVVFLHVDDTVNFHYIKKLAEAVERKMEDIESASQCAAVK